MKVAIVILNYNSEEDTIKYVESIKEYKNLNKIIVVDNNSTDATSMIAQKEGAKVVFCKEQGKGYAREFCRFYEEYALNHER